MHLDLLPTRAGSAPENMAVDFLLLQRYGAPQVRFRHYEWHRPAFTFGYSQKITWVREQLSHESAFELCRRPTGGGIVDHRDDWTYALVIPREHPWYDERASASYRAVHTCLADALRALGCDAVVNDRCENQPSSGEATSAQENMCARGPGVCFVRAELYDVIASGTRAKIAGAAQKRNKHGLLLQGSILRSAVASSLDWDSFASQFTQQLSTALNVGARESAWPNFLEDELETLIEHYSSTEWNELR